MHRSRPLLASLVLVATALILSCENKSTNPESGGELVSAPTFSPSGGTYTTSRSVTLSSATNGAAIYYTTGGSTPTISSTLYAGAITVSATETIEAIAVKNGTSSAVASATYTIGIPMIPWNTSISYDSFKDPRDGKLYKTVVIGKQTWFAENLDYTGTSAAPVGEWYENSLDTGSKFGRLYTWSEAMAGHESSTASPSGVQGVCPPSWHVPSDSEWSTLTTSIGGEDSAGTELKSTSGWTWSAYHNRSGNGTDSYGFRALPAGGDFAGPFNGFGLVAIFWSASVDTGSDAWCRYLGNSSANAQRYADRKGYGVSLRCIHD